MSVAKRVIECRVHRSQRTELKNGAPVRGEYKGGEYRDAELSAPSWALGVVEAAKAEICEGEGSVFVATSPSLDTTERET